MTAEALYELLGLYLQKGLPKDTKIHTDFGTVYKIHAERKEIERRYFPNPEGELDKEFTDWILILSTQQ